LLFYHVDLKFFVVIELKPGVFKPEYALKDVNKPIGISEYLLTQSIPQTIKSKLPSIEELEIDLHNKIIKESQ